MTLVRSKDENGDDILECERDSFGEYVWNPTPEQFASYLQRERELALANVAGIVIQRAILGDRSPMYRETIVIGRRCAGYVRGSRGNVLPYGMSSPPYLATSVERGSGISLDEHAHTHHTVARALASLSDGMACNVPVASRRKEE